MKSPTRQIVGNSSSCLCGRPSCRRQSEGINEDYADGVIGGWDRRDSDTANANKLHPEACTVYQLTTCYPIGTWAEPRCCFAGHRSIAARHPVQVRKVAKCPFPRGSGRVRFLSVPWYGVSTVLTAPLPESSVTGMLEKFMPIVACPERTVRPTTEPSAVLSVSVAAESIALIEAVLTRLNDKVKQLIEDEVVDGRKLTVTEIRYSTDDVVAASNFEVWDVPDDPAE